LNDVEQTIVLVKAWPQPSQKYGETVCCAGVTPAGEWRRLFPVRFRHLVGSAQFSRWDVVEYRPAKPRDDNRIESRRVDEQSLRRVRKMSEREREGFFDPLFRSSIGEAAKRNESLTLIRPNSLRFFWRPKSARELADEAEKRQKALRQGSLFDRELAKIEPCPYELRMAFDDADGPHEMACGDWETAATFFNWQKLYGAKSALERLKAIYEKDYFQAGVALALGTVKKRPSQWLLLGIIRLNETVQPRLL
jgi:hypothetical protein